MENKKLKRGQELELTISNLAFGGQAIAKLDDLIFFVKDAIPNQKIIARISKVKKKYVEAYKIETLEKSEDEINPKCNHFKYCGGCTIQQLDYKKQLFYKEKQVFDIFTKIGKVENPQINTIIGCDKIFFYRNKMEYTFSDNPWYIDNESYDSVIVGLHVPKRFDKILNIEKCHINYEKFNDIINISKEISNNEKMKAYDVVNHTGFLRYLVLRAGVYTNELMVNIVTSGFDKKLMGKFTEKILDKIPNITSIVNTINAEKNNTARGSTKIIYGSAFIHEKINNYKFKISPNSFFQTNSYQVKILYDYIIKAADFNKEDIVYDLYCGTGTIAIYISSFVKKVYGIELIEEAIDDAKFNAKMNSVSNAYFYASDLKGFFNKDNLDIEEPNTIIIDPPRPGLHPQVVQDIIELSPYKIIYVSCNPATQSRDVEIFNEKGFQIIDIQPIDMFPHTPHIECIVTLKK